MIRHCPVCGVPFRESYAGVNDLRSSFDICPCCGCEYGYDDTERHFQKWMSQGAQWFRPELKPENWLLEEQLKNRIRPWPPKEQ